MSAATMTAATVSRWTMGRNVSASSPFPIISWAEMYDTASMEAKKMIVNCLIKRVKVYRDYKLHIDFNIDFEQFTGGLDIVTIAA